MSRSSAITIGVILTAVVGAYSFGYLHTANPTPASTVESSFTGFSPSEVDLGERLWGQEVAFELRFFNGGAEPVVVSSVKSSCGCTILSGKDAFAQRQVAPGGSISIPGKLTAPKDPGQRTSVVTLTLTSGVTHTTDVKVNVKGTWALTPTALDFGEILLDSDGAQQPVGEVAVFESKTDSLRAVEVPVPWLEFHLAEDGPDRTRILVRVLPDRLPPGLNTAKVVVKTSSELKPAGVVFVRARGTHELLAIPEHVFLVGQDIVRVEFKGRDGQVARVVRAECDQDSILVRVSQSGKLELSSEPAVDLLYSARVRVVDVDGRKGSFLVSTFR